VLTRLGEVRLGVNTRFQVLDVEPIDGLITLRVAGQKHVLGQATAKQVIVREIKGPRDV
jgi:Fe2+ transport system protein FeoA